MSTQQKKLSQLTCSYSVLPSPSSSAEGDTKVIKSVERILTIWEDRGVYSGTLIAELRGSLVKEESPPETPVEQKSKCVYFFLTFFELNLNTNF